jgi:DNA-binding MltR family transcriptional regulator
VINSQSDFICVLIVASFLAEFVAGILADTFIKGSTTQRLLEPQGAIGGFATRVDLAYYLQLITKESHQDLTRIAQIRNKFAHNQFKLDFSDPEVQAICRELKTWRVLAREDYAEEVRKMNDAELTMLARNQFKMSAVFLGTRLHMDALNRRDQRK